MAAKKNRSRSRPEKLRQAMERAPAAAGPRRDLFNELVEGFEALAASREPPPARPGRTWPPSTRRSPARRSAVRRVP